MSLADLARRSANWLRLGWGMRKLGQAHSDAERVLAQRALTRVFSQARGITMKVGQLMADADQEETPFQDLLDNIEPMPMEQVLPVLARYLGQPVDNVFLNIEPAYAAASLGQVHRATLQDGMTVAVKIRYPDIDNAIESELKLAGLMPGLGPVKRWGFDLQGYKVLLKQNMDRELDYVQEAQYQQRFARDVAVPGLHVPVVFPAYTRNGVLVQEWVEGVGLSQAALWSVDDRIALGKVLLQTLFTSLFEAGLVHGDPHQGNYFYRKTTGKPEVVLLDYGCMVPIDQTARLALLKLILATREKTPVSALACFTAMGFDMDKLSNVVQALPMMCRILFRPFVSQERFRVRDWDVKKGIEALLGEQKWWFRSAGPADLLLLLRAFQGLARQLESLQVFTSWWDILLASVSDETIQKARALKLPEVPAELENRSRVDAIANALHVKVTENGRNRAEVSLPAELALDLKEIMPAEVLDEIQRAGALDLNMIEKQIIQSGIAPQLVFEYQSGAKQYKVWLK